MELQTLLMNEYESLEWDNIKYPGMVRIRTVADGSCFFHAFCNAFFKPYRTGKIVDENGNEKGISKRDIVKQLRNELADKLESTINDGRSLRYYDVISRGKLPAFSQEVPQYTLENMQKELRSDDPIDHIYNELISDIFNKDIYLLDYPEKDVYITGKDEDIFYKNRDSIVILTQPGHYELVGIRDSDNDIITLFKPTHPFISLIRSRLSSKLSS
jgi:hypothetical protein